MSGGRRFPTIVVALAVAVGLLLGLGLGWLIPRLSTPGDDSAEAGFARDMSTHHSQAVEMGLLAYRNGENPDVRQLGYDIATAQQGEIGAMQTWLRTWRLNPTGTQPRMAWMPDGQQALENGLMPGMATPEQMDQLRNAKGKDFDILFCQLMIRHHLGGVHMAEAILKATDDPDVVTLATSIKEGQQKEINIFNNLLAQMGAKPLQ